MKNINFINAGAGSGKTYRLTTDLARMLTQEDLNPSQVILTTYTELAAAEFREKARKEILNAKDANGQPVDVGIRIKSATELDNAFIGTVHAISYRFIRKYWYLLNYGADIQPMSDQNQDFYMSQSISDIVKEEQRKVFRDFREAFDIKVNGKPDYLFWLPELKEIVDKMEYYDIQTVDESIVHSIVTAKTIFHGMTAQMAASYINAYLPLLKDRCEGLINHGTFGQKAQRMIEAIDSMGRVGTLTDIRSAEMKTCLDDTVGNKKDDFYSSPEYLAATDAYRQAAISVDYLPIVTSYIKTIFKLAERWQKALLAYKQQNHVISFDDMEKIFLAMLTKPEYREVQEDIASNFRLLMVDEFQDSNPIQLKIFNRISELIAERGGRSIWVGDPKQAIYGFRGSDSRFISEILGKFKFSDDGSPVPMQGEDMLGSDQLLQSWRSRPKLVEFANKVFLKPFRNSGLKEKQITLQAHHTTKSDTLREDYALYIWRTEQSLKDARARMLANQIKGLIESGQQVHHKECDKPTSQITYRDIAVLCFSNDYCNSVAAVLRKIGLPVSCEETNLMQCMEIYLLKTILLFMQNPSDKMLRAELAMMLCDATTEDILKDRIQYVVDHRNTDEKAWDHWMDSDSKHQYAATISRLEEFTRRYQRLSVYDAVVAIHEELDLDNIVEKWGDATQRKHNLSTVVNMAKAYDDMCLQMGIGTSISGFINYLTITKPDNKTDNAANTIKVLTYHRSKGLEWPVVILYQLWKEFDKDEDLARYNFQGVNICEVDEQTTDVFDRKHYIHLFPTFVSGNSNLPELMIETILVHPLFSTIKSRKQEESLRLLYVGVTRAKDILVSFTSKKKNDDTISEWPKSLGISDGLSDKPFGEGYNEQLVELEESMLQEAGGGRSMYRQTMNVPALCDTPLLSLSPSTISSFDNPFVNNVKLAESEDRIIDMKMFAGESSDAVKGTCIHNIFAVYNPADTSGNINRITRTLANFGFRNVLLEHKERLILSIEWLYSFLSTHYGKAKRIEREYPLMYLLSSGQVLHGEIDLLWYYEAEDGDERCVLVDYKTFPGQRSELETHTEKYYAQLSAYHAALTSTGVKVTDTLIYYPVQAHIRKLLK